MKIKNLYIPQFTALMGAFLLFSVSIGYAADTDAENIRERVDQEVERALIAEGERAAESQRLTNAAARKMELGEYPDARRLLERALELDPTNAGAKSRFEEVDALLPATPDTRAELIRSEEVRALVREQASLVEVKSLLDNAANRAREAQEVTGNDDADPAAVEGGLQQLRKAAADIQRAQLKLKAVSGKLKSDEPRQRATVLEKSISGLITELSGLSRDITRRRALAQAEREKEIVEDYEAKQHAALIAQAERAIEMTQWEEAESALREVLDDNPRHEIASNMLELLRRNRIAYQRRQVEDKEINERKDLLLQIEEAAVPRYGNIVYPDDWDEMMRRRGAQLQVTGDGHMEEWELEIRRKMDMLVGFEFQETPLSEVVKFLSGYTGINIIYAGGQSAGGGGDTGGMGDFGGGGGGGGGERTITLRLENVRLDNALNWIMRISDMDYAIEDGAIIIDEVEALESDYRPIVYDVSDLARSVQDAPSNMGDDDDDDDDEEDIQLEDIITKISPNEWVDGRGAINRINNDTLVIRQRDEVHELIRQTLSRLRAAQAIQVAVTARFLDVNDGEWEEFSSAISDFANNVDEDQNRGTLTGPTVYNQADHGRHYLDAQGTMSHNAPSLLGSLLPSKLTLAVGADGINMDVLQWGYLGQLQTRWLMHAVRKDEIGDQLWAPSLMVYNNRRAWVEITEEEPFTSGYTVGAGGGWQPELAYAETGSRLMVRPTVSSDKRYISLDVRAETTQVLGFTTRSISWTDYNGVQQSLPVEMPEQLVQNTRTTATMPDGGSIILSGMGININGRTVNGVPILSDLPVIGKAFSGRGYQKEKRSVMIMVTARMILLDEEEAKLTR